MHVNKVLIPATIVMLPLILNTTLYFLRIPGYLLALLVPRGFKYKIACLLAKLAMETWLPQVPLNKAKQCGSQFPTNKRLTHTVIVSTFKYLNKVGLHDIAVNAKVRNPNYLNVK